MMRGIFDHSGRLVRWMLRRERTISTLWVVSLLLFSAGLAHTLGTMFDDAARQALAATMQNPGMIAMMGPVYGADNYTPGAMYSNNMLLWTLIAVAVMNIFLVVRHTRGDEEKGRAEVIRSLPTGRLAILNSTMLTAWLVNTLLALTTGLGNAALGIESMDFAGSMLYGAALGVSGLLFAAIAAIAAQLSASSRGAMGYAFFALGLLYMLRAAGDIGCEPLSLISPMGLIQRSQIYVANHWWPVLVVLLEALLLTLLAYALNAVRDLGQGFLPARLGRETASFTLRTPLGLAWRLLRSTLIVWTIVMFLLGASYGSILDEIERFVAESSFYQKLLGLTGEYSASEFFTSMVTSITSLLGLIPLLTLLLKSRSEEKDGRAEQVLARVVSRRRYLGGFATLAFSASVLFQGVAALGLYAAGAAVLPEPVAFGLLLKAHLVYLPALWAMLGLGVLLVGLLPRVSNAIWLYFAFSFFTVFIGRLTALPEWLNQLSPFTHIPQIPVGRVEPLPLAGLTALAVILTIAGFVSYGKREVAA